MLSLGGSIYVQRQNSLKEREEKKIYHKNSNQKKAENKYMNIRKIVFKTKIGTPGWLSNCLLYTSDAADDVSWV